MTDEFENRKADLLNRIKKTTKSRYRASERLERHHKLSQWTVALISCGLIFIPIAQVFGVGAKISAEELNAIQAILAVLVLVYSLLLGQESFISRSQDMQRNGVDLGRMARKVVGSKENLTDEEYNSLVEEYYSILEKYENHKPVDYLFTQLAYPPSIGENKLLYFGSWLKLVFIWLKAQALRALGLSHYVVVSSFVFYSVYSVMTGNGFF